IQTGSRCSLVFDFISEKSPVKVHFAFGLLGSHSGYCLYCTSYAFNKPLVITQTEGSIKCIWSKFPVVAGKYRLNMMLVRDDGTIEDSIQEVIDLEVGPGDYYGTGYNPKSDEANVLSEYQFEVI